MSVCVCLCKVLCSMVAGLLHYLFLTSFTWMCMEGVQLYVMLVEVFEVERSRVRWYYVVAYGNDSSVHSHQPQPQQPTLFVPLNLRPCRDAFIYLYYLFVILVMFLFVRCFTYFLLFYILLVLVLYSRGKLEWFCERLMDMTHPTKNSHFVFWS